MKELSWCNAGWRCDTVKNAARRLQRDVFVAAAPMNMPNRAYRLIGEEHGEVWAAPLQQAIRMAKHE